MMAVAQASAYDDTVTLDGKSVGMDLPQGDKSGDTRFDRFGIVTPWIDGNGQVVYFDENGHIKPIKITFEGVEANPLD